MIRLTAGLSALVLAAGTSAGELGFGAATRGSAGADGPGGPHASFTDDFDSLPLLPASLNSSNSTGVWGGVASGLSGRPRLATFAPPFVGAVADPIAGNATTKLRAQVGAGNPLGHWLRYDLAKRNNPDGTVAARATFRPSSAFDMRMAQDIYVTSITSGWSVRPADVSEGVILAMVLWGGEQPIGPIGFPPGPVTHFYTMAPGATPEAFFVVCKYIGSAPVGSGVGDPVSAPVGSWFRLIIETTITERMRVKIDLDLDGPGPEHLMYEGDSPASIYSANRFAFTGAFEVVGDAMYVDHLTISGALDACPGDANLDNTVNFADLNIVLAQFGQSGSALQGDVNSDGVVNFADLNATLSQFGVACPPNA